MSKKEQQRWLQTALTYGSNQLSKDQELVKETKFTITFDNLRELLLFIHPRSKSEDLLLELDSYLYIEMEDPQPVPGANNCKWSIDVNLETDPGKFYLLLEVNDSQLLSQGKGHYLLFGNVGRAVELHYYADLTEKDLGDGFFQLIFRGEGKLYSGQKLSSIELEGFLEKFGLKGRFFWYL